MVLANVCNVSLVFTQMRPKTTFVSKFMVAKIPMESPSNVMFAELNIHTIHQAKHVKFVKLNVL
jgi:hypothetical protein